MPDSRLPHYSNSKVSVNNYEPLQPNLFDVVITLPNKLDGTNLELLHEHINTIGGLQGINPALGLIEQKFKNTTRSFAGMPDTTSIDVSIEFSMNLNEANQAYTWKILRDWYRLMYDPDTGYAGLKKDYIGSMEIHQYNRNGDVYRKIQLHEVFPTTAPEAMDSLDYSSSEPFAANVTFRCDYYNEELA